MSSVSRLNPLILQSGKLGLRDAAAPGFGEDPGLVDCEGRRALSYEAVGQRLELGTCLFPLGTRNCLRRCCRGSPHVRPRFQASLQGPGQGRGQGSARPDLPLLPQVQPGRL